MKDKKEAEKISNDSFKFIWICFEKCERKGEKEIILFVEKYNREIEIARSKGFLGSFDFEGHRELC
jgi:hypothetical protein